MSCSWLDGVACVVVSLNLMLTGSCPWLDGVACVVVRLNLMPTGSCPWLDGVACVVTTLVSCPCHDDVVCIVEVMGWGMSQKSYVGVCEKECGGLCVIVWAAAVCAVDPGFAFGTSVNLIHSDHRWVGQRLEEGPLAVLASCRDSMTHRWVSSF